jgi:hypothetical protein
VPVWALRKLPVRPSDQHLETGLGEINADLLEADFGPGCDRWGSSKLDWIVEFFFANCARAVRLARLARH